MYRNNLVVSLRSTSKKSFFPEVDGKVQVPFGSEYSLYIKNLFTRKALVEISIDGTDYGVKLVIEPNSSQELVGWRDNKSFKFIEKTDRISAHRGDRIDDGLIRISYQFEREIVHFNPPPFGGGVWYNNGPLFNDRIPTWISSAVGSTQATTNSVLRSTGITTKGSDVDVNFVPASIGPLEDTEHVMILQLIGEFQGTPITQAQSRVKRDCDVCGTRNPSGAFYCSHCGTNLKI